MTNYLGVFFLASKRGIELSYMHFHNADISGISDRGPPKDVADVVLCR